MASLRLFTAVEIPGNISSKISSTSQRVLRDPSLRLVANDSMHITLNFIGDVEDRETPELCRRLEKALDGVCGFPVSIQGFGGFPNLARPRVLWIGVEQGREELVMINRKLRDAIEDFGLLQEKRYSPHLTLARVQSRQLDADRLQSIQSTFERMQWNDFYAAEVIVYNSILEKEGPTYIPMARLKLD